MTDFCHGQLFFFSAFIWQLPRNFPKCFKDFQTICSIRCIIFYKSNYNIWFIFSVFPKKKNVQH